MRRVVLITTLLLALHAAGPAYAAPPGKGEGLSEEERAFCASELEVIDRRRKVFEGQGLSASEVARRNEPQQRALAECRDRFRVDRRRDVEQKQDVEEVSRRAGPDATELERDRVWKEVRRERLASRSASSLTAEERAELAAGMGDEMRATHHALDDAHQRDPSFMRVIHSALACYHGERRSELKDLISSEESLLNLGTGDRQKLYALKSELRVSNEVLARNAEAARALPGGLDRCTSPTVAVVTHCLAARLAGPRSEPACESEDIQQYVRFVK
ncbi:MAG TPA: hypothetical protein VF912_21375 [Anaeromyxobacter sp.]